jgi:predicted DNA-binding protein (MmcQ/YjbR family)
MTEYEFRQLALAMPGAVEASHMGHPDFRIKGKIFASLQPVKSEACVKLRPDQQEMVVVAEPAVVRPVNGAWGRHGWTWVTLGATDKVTALSLIKMAFANVVPAAPKTTGQARKPRRPRTTARTSKSAAAKK